jgi:hypothetical protein
MVLLKRSTYCQPSRMKWPLNIRHTLKDSVITDPALTVIKAPPAAAVIAWA